MCGIAGIVNLGRNEADVVSAELIEACKVIDHRGPDDEGFLTWNYTDIEPQVLLGKDSANSTHEYWKYDSINPDAKFSVGLGHRRLSILDLSPLGHQPMFFKQAGLAISFNGEIYNYLEIKAELLALGHQFVGTGDTEVILHAWAEWGVNCLDKFNGMFAFLIFDYQRKKLYGVRDRFGVKPLYYSKLNDKLIISSEIKQIKINKSFVGTLNEGVIANYLAFGDVDTTTQTFDKQIHQVPGGHYLEVDLNLRDFDIKPWYRLTPAKWRGSWNDAVEQFRYLLTDAVRLRLRSDVPVGSCLSGGLDSSSIVCLAADILKEQGEYAGQETVTACYEEARYDEWNFAKQVIEKTKARSHRTFPSFGQLESEIDKFLWHQDEPTGSTSQFSQWAVFKRTHEAGLKVMIDGQGADEQLAGYGGNDLPLYAGLLGAGRYNILMSEAKAYKQANGKWPYGFILGGLQLSYTGLGNLLPARWRLSNDINIGWMNRESLAYTVEPVAKSLQQNLLRQVHHQPLPGLLRYEDRNSMAWSVESRTPFMDYRLMEFTLGLPEEFVYEKGIRKKILREAMSYTLPAAISNRRDKMGFVTPEELWLKKEGTAWFKKNIESTIELFPSYFDKDKLMSYYSDVVSGKLVFDFTLWRVLCLGRWFANASK